MKGWKTILFGLFMIIVPPALNYLVGVDWQSLGVSPGISAMIGAAIIGLRALTSTPIGKATIVVVLPAFGLAGMLAACGGGAQQTGVDLVQDAGYGVVRNLAPADLAQLQQTCQAAAPALAVATGGVAAQTVKDVAVYPAAFCRQLVTGARGNVADQSSLTWLPQVLSMVKSAATIAGFILPLL